MQASGEPAHAAVAAVAQAVPEGWWDGTATLAAGSPEIVEQGPCNSYGDGGSVALLAGGPLSQACAGGATVSAPGGVLAGSARGVGWFDGFDDEGPYVAVELVGDAGVAEGVCQSLGSLDVVFYGGTFTADFAGCEHRTQPGYSSCLAVVAEASLPPSTLVGVTTDDNGSVTHLCLSSNSLSGSIPTELGDLTNLTSPGSDACARGDTTAGCEREGRQP